MRGRLMFNGDLIYPKRGNKPPPPIEGYEPDEKDPWVHHKVYAPCKHRTFKNIPTPCGIKKYIYFCNRVDFITNHIACDNCKEKK